MSKKERALLGFKYLVLKDNDYHETISYLLFVIYCNAKVQNIGFSRRNCLVAGRTADTLDVRDLPCLQRRPLPAFVVADR
jgi:hypothetical protein